MSRSKASLLPEHREFWTMAAEAAFANPFSSERDALDVRLVGHFHNEDERLALLRTKVTEQADALEKLGCASLRHFSGPEREMMRTGFLFELYHVFAGALDDLISAQIAAGDTPCPVPFASEALGLFRKRGFAEEEALRFFGIFYQLRRGFYFILKGLAGRSPCMQELRRHLWRNLFTQDVRWYDRYLWNRMEDFSTMLLGETGTGKGTAAAAIGRSGFIPYLPAKGCFAESFTRTFISLNLSQYPDALIESELFGHKKGAFTGAIEAHEGIFARCSPHGAIFLDELGEVSIPTQIKLLQVLQERTFSPVGSREKLRFRGRVIAATNRSLDDLRDRKIFRDDFFYRLCSDLITVPPLRQRLREVPEELHLLIEEVVSRMTGERAPELVRVLKDTLEVAVGPDYLWPGNVRELEQAVRRILLTSSYQGSQPRKPLELAARLTQGITEGSIDAEMLLSGYCRLLYDQHGTYEAVRHRANLDRRTVKKYLDAWTARERAI